MQEKSFNHWTPLARERFIEAVEARFTCPYWLEELVIFPEPHSGPNAIGAARIHETWVPIKVLTSQSAIEGFRSWYPDAYAQSVQVIVGSSMSFLAIRQRLIYALSVYRDRLMAGCEREERVPA